MMVNTYNSNNIAYPLNSGKTPSTKPMQPDIVSFKGHVGVEKSARKGIEILRHETAFFREPQTDNFVKEHIINLSQNKDKIKIISGACSTGEEAVSYSMMLNAIKDKIDILGFDISSKSIEQAKKRSYIFEKPAEESKKAAESLNISGFKDSYLAFDSSEALSSEQKTNKKIFDDFFEITSEKVPEEKIPLMTRFQIWLTNKLYKTEPIHTDKKLCKLKEGKAENCKFIQGDIEDIRNITGDEKADVILFRNALYHLTTQEIGAMGLRVPKKESESIIENIGRKIKDSLNDNGILVFGEEEPLQMADDKTVPKVMKRLGFVPMNETSEHYANVWQKVGSK